MIEQEPNMDEQATAPARAARLRLNQPPWTVQSTFRGVLLTLIPWISFNLFIGLGGNGSTPQHLSFSQDLGSAIGTIFLTTFIEGFFLLAPYYYANKALVLENLQTGWTRARAVFRSLGLRAFPFLRTLPWIIGLMILIVAFGWFYNWIIATFHLNLQTNGQTVLQYSSYEPLTTYAILAGSVFIAPICEEIFFRGFVLPGLLRELSPAWSIVISAALFAVAHTDAGSFVPLLAIGLCLGFLRWRTGSTWASFSLHMLNNLLASVELVLAMHHINLPF